MSRSEKSKQNMARESESGMTYMSITGRFWFYGF